MLPTTSCQAISRYTVESPLGDSIQAGSRPLDHDKIRAILKAITPITLPYRDREERIIQLRKYKTPL